MPYADLVFKCSWSKTAYDFHSVSDIQITLQGEKKKNTTSARKKNKKFPLLKITNIFYRQTYQDI